MDKILPPPDWESLLRDQKTSGMTIQEFCKERNLSPHAFKYHRCKWNKKTITEVKDKKREFIELPSQDFRNRYRTENDKSIDIQIHIRLGEWLNCEIKLG